MTTRSSLEKFMSICSQAHGPPATRSWHQQLFQQLPTSERWRLHGALQQDRLIWERFLKFDEEKRWEFPPPQGFLQYPSLAGRCWMCMEKPQEFRKPRDQNHHLSRYVQKEEKATTMQHEIELTTASKQVSTPRSKRQKQPHARPQREGAKRRELAGQFILENPSTPMYPPIQESPIQRDIYIHIYI